MTPRLWFCPKTERNIREIHDAPVVVLSQNRIPLLMHFLYSGIKPNGMHLFYRIIQGG
jgi:hypothetical protein